MAAGKGSDGMFRWSPINNNARWPIVFAASMLSTGPNAPFRFWKTYHFQEPGIVRTRTGRIVAAIRNQGEDNAIWTTWSDNDGKTWMPWTDVKLTKSARPQS